MSLLYLLAATPWWLLAAGAFVVLSAVSFAIETVRESIS